MASCSQGDACDDRSEDVVVMPRSQILMEAEERTTEGYFSARHRRSAGREFERRPKKRREPPRRVTGSVQSHNVGLHPRGDEERARDTGQQTSLRRRDKIAEHALCVVFQYQRWTVRRPEQAPSFVNSPVAFSGLLVPRQAASPKSIVGNSARRPTLSPRGS
eukprot:GEMP01073119.1.p1 GENE.GEMP01073119.1~~GEMP01073119.1.p1  ORF type:complete len:162 (+),score=25.45 GEMP01073119.1:387-872(+)